MKHIMVDFQQQLLAHQNKEAIICGNQTFSYDELVERSMSLAIFFKHQGIQTNDRIVVNLSNGMDFIFCYFACLLHGFTIIPINPKLPQKDIEYIVDITHPKLVIDCSEQLDFSHEGKTSIVAPNLSEKDIAAIFFTSGTTSRPKGVCHRLQSLIANVRAFNQQQGINEQCRMMHVMPMGYMAGFLNTILSPLCAGGTVIIAPQFDAKSAFEFWQPAFQHNINALWLTPTMMNLLLRTSRSEDIFKWTKKHLISIFVGTAPLLETTKNAFEKKFHVECLESYGMTEVMLVSSCLLNTPHKTGAVGRLLPDVKISVRSNTEQVTELWIQTPFALVGYLDPENGDILSPLDDGWIATGDAGYVDKQNDLFINGRIKDIIIHGGINVSPSATEECILGYKGIQDVVVVGIPHDFWGEEVIAFVIMLDSVPYSESDLMLYCQEHLSPDATPTRLMQLDEFPRSATGKVQKHDLKALL